MKTFLLTFFPFTNKLSLWITLFGSTVFLAFLISEIYNAKQFVLLLGMPVVFIYMLLSAYCLFTKQGAELLNLKNSTLDSRPKRKLFWWLKLFYGSTFCGFLTLVLVSIFIPSITVINNNFSNSDEFFKVFIFQAFVAGLIYVPLLFKYLK